MGDWLWQPRMGSYITLLETGRSVARDEALEYILQRLEDHALIFHPNGPHQVCLNCWEIWEDGTCECEHARYWPIDHAIERLRGLCSNGS